MSGIFNFVKVICVWAAFLLLFFTAFTFDQVQGWASDIGSGIENVADAFSARL